MNEQKNPRNGRPAVLSIAGFDPSGGSGVLTDSAVIRALGFHPLAVLTSIAAQGSSRVAEIQPLARGFMMSEFAVVAAEFSPAAAKIGMLYSPAAVRLAAAFLQHKKIPAVLDPVIKASSGGDLVQLYALPLIQDRLMPLCRLVTPNIEEAGYFLKRPIKDPSEAEDAARELSRRWRTSVLLKGGHLPGNPVDILVEGDQVERFPHARVANGKKVRGTGCALSTALAVGLARGLVLREAIPFALEFLQKALQRSYEAGNQPAVAFLDLLS